MSPAGNVLLAYTVTVCGTPVRGSLRAAYLLAARPGSVSKLLDDLSTASLTAMCDVVRAAADDAAADEFAKHFTYSPRKKVIFDADAEWGLPVDPVHHQLMRFVVALYDFDTGEAADPGTPKITFDEACVELYRIGTGWLGWTPADTWAASPREIIEAHKGRVALLKAIFGSAEDDTPKEPDYTRDEKATAWLKAQALSGANKRA